MHAGRSGRLAPLATALALLCASPAGATTTTIIPADVSGGAFRTSASFTVSDTGWAPTDAAVAPGASVAWNGPLAAHPLLFDDGTPGAATGTSFARVMQVPGRYAFHSPDAGVGELGGTLWVGGPVPKLYATQVAPPDPRVRLDASATEFIAFEEGSGAVYEVDADGDGVFDTSGANPVTTYRYPGEGSYTARLRVTDDNGFTGEATATVTVDRDSVPPEADTTAPKLQAASLVPVARRAVRRGTTIVVGTPSESVTATVTLERGATLIAKGVVNATGQQLFTVRLRPTSAGKRLLLRVRPSKATLRVVLVDAGGNRTTVKRSVRLKRP